MATSMSDRAYGRMVALNTTFDDAIDAATAALKEQGFGVLTTIEVDKVLREKIGVDRDRYTILGACNPQFANQGLEADIDLGLLLPCNVTVREEAGKQLVTFVDPKAMLAAAGDSPALDEIATEVKQRLDAAADALAAR